MDLNELLNCIILSGSNFSRSQGEKIFRSGLVSNIKGKRIDGIYHIYGDVKDEKTDKAYNSHVKIDIEHNVVKGCSCSCDDFIKNSKVHKDFKCKHIMAIVYKFYYSAKKKIEDRARDNKENNSFSTKKKSLSLNIKIKNMKVSTCEYYLVEFWIGDSTFYLISNIKEFIEDFNSKVTFAVSGKFVYDSRIHELDREGKRVLNFISIYLSKGKTLTKINQQKVQGKSLLILEEDLLSFLENLNEGNSLSINHDFINFKSIIEKSDMPISFTLKLRDNNLVLTTKNKLPIPLDKNMNVFLYERNIYIPSKEQVRNYLPLYNKFVQKEEVIYKNTLENLKGILKSLYIISNDINFTEAVSRLVEEIQVPQFFFYKEKENIYCQMKINYGIEVYNEALVQNKFKFTGVLTLEEKIIMELERLRFIRTDDRFIFIGEEKDIYNLLASELNKLSKIGKIHLSKDFQDIKLITFTDFQYFIENDDGNFYFNYKMSDFTLKELRSAIDSMKNKKSFYKTKKNSYLDLKDDGVKVILNILDSLNIEETDENKFRIDKNQLLFLEESIKNSDLRYDKGEETLKSISEKLAQRDEIEGDIPIDFNGSLRNYQVIGLNWLKEISNLGLGGILADEMGLGKTIQVISFLLGEDGKKSLIITPTSLIYNWKSEFLKFAPTLKIVIVYGSKKERMKHLENIDDIDVLLTTYGTLKSDYEFYRDREFQYCIIDEAQNIKNSKSQSSKFVKSIKASCKIALTGTPMENNLMELWSIFDFIMPGYLLSEEKFKDKFANNDDNFQDLNQLIKPFILRRMKKDVALELPDKIEKKYYVEMPLEQKQIYKSYMKEVKMKIKRGDSNKISIFSYLTKLRQICLDPSLLLDEYLGRSGKMSVAGDLVKEAITEQRKMLIFSQFTSVLKKFGEYLQGENIKYLYLDGETKAKDRVKLVNEFNSDDNTKVFLISLKAGGTGLNLTSADLVIHFDPWWNPATEDQATDRAHRIGQRNIVEVIKLVSKDTIEEKIIEMQEDKRELISKVISGDNMQTNLLSKLSNEEILDLFN